MTARPMDGVGGLMQWAQVVGLETEDQKAICGVANSLGLRRWGHKLWGEGRAIMLKVRRENRMASGNKGL
jgi:hypothetical protein